MLYDADVGCDPDISQQRGSAMDDGFELYDPYEYRDDDRYEEDSDYPEVSWPDDNDDGRVEDPYVDDDDPYQYGDEERDMYDDRDEGLNSLDFADRYGFDF